MAKEQERTGMMELSSERQKLPYPCNCVQWTDSLNSSISEKCNDVLTLLANLITCTVGLCVFINEVRSTWLDFL